MEVEDTNTSRKKTNGRIKFNEKTVIPISRTVQFKLETNNKHLLI